MAKRNKKTEIINIDSSMSKVIKYFVDRNDVTAVYLFGSYNTEYQTPLSDVDFAILFLKDKVPDSETMLDLYAALSMITEEDNVNIVVLNTAPITLQFDVVSTGTILLKKENYLEEFHELLFKLYGDFVIDLKRFYDDYDEALRERYVNGK